jgi:SAM-dependent MidA family methyltransferase
VPGFATFLVEDTEIHAVVEREETTHYSFATDSGGPIVDHGPGAGLLMRYLLGSLPDEVRERTDVTFVEPRLARRTRLLVLLQEFGVDGRVVSAPRDVDSGPAFVVARELLGSFPVHWLERVDDGWREVHVEIPSKAWQPRERLEQAPPQLGRHVDEHAAETPAGHRYEVNLHVRRWLAQLAQTTDPGLIYVLDRPIQDPPGTEGSILALRDGEPVDPYEAPGITDISSGVDLDALVQQAEQAGFREVTEPVGAESNEPLEAVALASEE